MGLETIGKLLLVFGGILVFLGLFFLLVGRVPYIGRLPGDILIQKGNFTFYFPLVTLLLLSVLLTIVLNIVLRLLR